MQDIRAVLFDKDGTLFDFRKTWGAWTADLIRDLGGKHAPTLAEAMRFDLTAGQHMPDSKVIAGTLDDWVDLMLPVLTDRDPTDLKAEITTRTATATQVPATPLPPLLGQLKRAGYPMGVATNDGIGPVTQHLRDAAIDHFFTFVAGYDSGHGAKPDPGMLLAFADHTNVPPSQIAMVGDSTHDMAAARAAGMRRVAVLTGHATAQDLAPHADIVLKTIAELPAWLGKHPDR